MTPGQAKKLKELEAESADNTFIAELMEAEERKIRHRAAHNRLLFPSNPAPDFLVTFGFERKGL